MATVSNTVVGRSVSQFRWSNSKAEASELADRLRADCITRLSGPAKDAVLSFIGANGKSLEALQALERHNGNPALFDLIVANSRKRLSTLDFIAMVEQFQHQVDVITLIRDNMTSTPVLQGIFRQRENPTAIAEMVQHRDDEEALAFIGENGRLPNRQDFLEPYAQLTSVLTTLLHDIPRIALHPEFRPVAEEAMAAFPPSDGTAIDVLISRWKTMRMPETAEELEQGNAEALLDDFRTANPDQFRDVLLFALRKTFVDGGGQLNQGRYRSAMPEVGFVTAWERGIAQWAHLASKHRKWSAEPDAFLPPRVLAAFLRRVQICLNNLEPWMTLLTPYQPEK